MYLRVTFVCVVCLAMLCCASWGRAETAAVELNTFTLLTGDFSLGWRFTPTEPMIVTALGVFDPKGDGVNDKGNGGQPVTLYEWGGTTSTAGDPLASVLVPLTATAEPAGSVNAYYVDINPITLTVGTDYFVAAYTVDFAHSATFLNDDDRPFDRAECAGFAVGGGMPALANTTTFTIGGSSDPVHGTGIDDWFGGTFKYAAVPEPSTMMLLLTGIVAAFAWRRR